VERTRGTARSARPPEAAGRAGDARRAFEDWAAELPVQLQEPGYEEDRAEARARIEHFGGRPEEALASFERAARLRDCRRCFRLETADVLAELGRTDEARPLLAEARARAPGIWADGRLDAQELH